MKSQALIQSLFSPDGAPRIGMNFGLGRRNDLCGASAGLPQGYTQRRWVEGETEYYDDMWGNIWHRMQDGSAQGEIYRPVLQDWEQLPKLKMPVFDRATVTGRFRSGFEPFPDHFKIAGLPGWIFASARYLRKLENYLLDMALYPEELKRLHAKIAELYALLIEAAGDAGADGIFFCEDLGTQRDLLFSPEMWMEYFSELYRGLFTLAHERGMRVLMHSCGNNHKLLEPLLQAGVNCFQFDQPRLYDRAFLSALLQKYHAALWAPVDIQMILPTGDKALIQADARQMCQDF
ncbi:MAG: hypothetical protein GX564_10115 [Oligosphaeraceae bacterium]|nr:hypothetical protein [Oligosphaeraceae bacterium]